MGSPPARRVPAVLLLEPVLGRRPILAVEDARLECGALAAPVTSRAGYLGRVLGRRCCRGLDGEGRYQVIEQLTNGRVVRLKNVGQGPAQQVDVNLVAVRVGEMVHEPSARPVHARDSEHPFAR